MQYVYRRHESEPRADYCMRTKGPDHGERKRDVVRRLSAGMMNLRIMGMHMLNARLEGNDIPNFAIMN